MFKRWSLVFACLLCHALLIAGDPRLEARERLKWLGELSRTSTPHTVLHSADSVLRLPATADDPFIQQGLHAYRGRALRLLGRFDEAITAHMRAYALADSLDDYPGLIDARMVISLIYTDLRQLDKAQKELLAIYALTQERPIDRNYRITKALGYLADLKEELDTALYWYSKAQLAAEEAGDSSVACEIHYNQGIICREQRAFERSEMYLQRGLAWLPSAGYPQVESRIQQALARLYLMQGQYDMMPALLDRSTALAQAHGASDLLINIYSDRIDLQLGTGDTAAALGTIQRLMGLKDSLAVVLREEAIAEAEAKFGVTRMEEELALTKAEAEVNALRAQRSWIAWGALAVISVLAAILIFNFRKQYLAKKKAAQALEQDKDRLAEENEFLHQENLMARFETLKSQIDPHFLFNAMNTLYTLVETEPKKAREFVSSFSALYRKVLTSRERTIVPVKEELELVHHYLFLQRIRFGESLQVTVDVPASALHRYLPPFTLQMLLENAVKHNVISAAHPLHIHIGVEQDKLVVRNDLRPRGTSAEGTGTGLENIRKRYAMLGAPEPTFAVSDPYYKAAVPMLSHEP